MRGQGRQEGILLRRDGQLIDEHLRLPGSGHRIRLPLEMQPYSSGLRGGVAGAVAMALVASVYGLLAEGSLWYPINLLASAVLPSMNLANEAQLRAFDGTALLAAAIMHTGLSLLVGLVYAALLPTLPGRTLLWGGLVAPAAWSGLAWVSLGIVAPALNEHIAWGWFIASQAAFGLTAGYVIQQIEPVALVQRAPFAARAGLEAVGVAVPIGDEPRQPRQLSARACRVSVTHLLPMVGKRRQECRKQIN